MMTSTELALPMACMMLLTLLVWIALFVKRVGYMQSHKIDVEQMKSPADTAALLPSATEGPSNNLKNLFELPVVFYAVCLYLTVFGQVDAIHVYSAWAFVLLRALHSVIHCSYNRVMHRFLAYLLSSLALWVMVVRVFIASF